MVKITPNPPKAENLSAYTTLDSKKLREAADRALKVHLSPAPVDKPDTQNGQVFAVVPGLNTESVLVSLSETLASANALASDLAFELEGSRRHVALGIQQLIESGALLANRALDDVGSGRSLSFVVQLMALSRASLAPTGLAASCENSLAPTGAEIFCGSKACPRWRHD